MIQSLGGSLPIGTRFNNRRMAHSDPLDWVTWKDEGCRYAPKCLECPFPHCLYEGATDMSTGPRNKRTVNSLVVQQIVADYDLGTQQGRKAAREAAMATTGLSERTVRRHMG